MERSFYYIASGDNGQEHGTIKLSGCACTPTGIKRKVTIATRGIPFRKDTGASVGRLRPRRMRLTRLVAARATSILARSSDWRSNPTGLAGQI